MRNMDESFNDYMLEQIKVLTTRQQYLAEQCKEIKSNLVETQKALIVERQRSVELRLCTDILMATVIAEVSRNDAGLLERIRQGLDSYIYTYGDSEAVCSAIRAAKRSLFPDDD